MARRRLFGDALVVSFTVRRPGCRYGSFEISRDLRLSAGGSEAEPDIVKHSVLLVWDVKLCRSYFGSQPLYYTRNIDPIRIATEGPAFHA